jgi:hypothetical protein
MTRLRQVAILGSTGSIGRSALAVMESLRATHATYALAARSSWKPIREQALLARPRVVVLTDPAAAKAFREAGVPDGTRLIEGLEGIREVVTAAEVDIVLGGIAGAEGLPASLWAAEAGKTLAIANKESYVIAGELLTRRNGVFALTPTLGLACSRLAATSGMSALSTQRLQRLSHFAALRIADLGLWLVEFSDITADEFNVRITSVAQTDMYHRLKAGLAMPENQRSAGPPTPPPREAASRPEAARKQEPVKEKQAHCPSCGSELRADARFCAKCGYRLAKKQ